MPRLPLLHQIHHLIITYSLHLTKAVVINSYLCAVYGAIYLFCIESYASIMLTAFECACYILSNLPLM